MSASRTPPLSGFKTGLPSVAQAGLKLMILLLLLLPQLLESQVGSNHHTWLCLLKPHPSSVYWAAISQQHRLSPQRCRDDRGRACASSQGTFLLIAGRQTLDKEQTGLQVELSSEALSMPEALSSFPSTTKGSQWPITHDSGCPDDPTGHGSRQA